MGYKLDWLLRFAILCIIYKKCLPQVKNQYTVSKIFIGDNCFKEIETLF